MAVYKVKEGQNLFDVAVTLYGSIEGISYLMFLNSELGLGTELKAGDELEYDSGFIVNKDMLEAIDKRKAIVANGKRHIQYKQCDLTKRMVLKLDKDEELIKISWSGNGKLVIDWGDNSDLESINMQNGETKEYSHYFDNKTTTARIITFYGNFTFQTLDVSKLHGEMYILSSFQIEQYISDGGTVNIDSLALARELYSVVYSKHRAKSLMHLKDLNLQYLELSNNIYENLGVIDELFIYIASHYGTRRPCEVKLDISPSGEYREPEKDDFGNYIITTGMEAVYVITHEADWNQAGVWKFDINGHIYTYSV